MPIITKLGFQKNQKRVNLYLDGAFAFGLSTLVVLKRHLKVHQKLSALAVKKLMFASWQEELYEASLRFLGLRPRSQKEITDYLRHRKLKQYQFKGIKSGIDKTELAIAGPALIDKTIIRLKEKGFINDHEFCRWLIKQRIEHSPRGKRALRAELRQKGIGAEVIEEILTDDSLYPIEVEKNGVRQAAEKAWKQLIGGKSNLGKREDKITLKRRLYQRLASRGFPFNLIKEVVDELINKE